MQITQEGNILAIDLFADGPVDKTDFTLGRLKNLPLRKFDPARSLWLVPLVAENWASMTQDAALACALREAGIEEPSKSAYRIGRYKNLLALRVPPSPADIQKCRGIPEYRMWNEDLTAWVFRATQRNVEYVRQQWPGIGATPEAVELVKESLGVEAMAKPVARKAVVNEGGPLQEKLSAKAMPLVEDYKFGTQPFVHQANAFLLSRNEEAYALFMEQGTGKTKVAIDTAAWLYLQGKITGVIVICPNAVKSNWGEDEIPTHLPPYINARTVVWKSTMAKPEQAGLDQILGQVDKEFLSVLIMNVEAFSGKKGQDIASKFLARHQTLAIVDESSRIKTPGAKRTKAILKIGRQASFRRILTGTPVTQGPLDLFAQFKFLDDRILGFGSFYSFRNHFCILGGFKGKQVIAYANLDELQKLIDPHSFRVTKDECLDLPPKVFTKLTVDLTAEQKRLYKQMKTDMLTELGGHNAGVTEVIVQMLRLQQIVGGFLPIQDEETGKHEPMAIPGGNPKIDALLEVLEDTQGKAIVWARFRAELDLIAKALREKFGDDAVVEFHGGVDEMSRTRYRKEFQDPKSPVKIFVGQTETGGIGLTLTEARTVVYYSNSFSLESRLQSEDRAHRIGQKHSVTYVDLVARGTLDAHLLGTLRSKKSLANTITGDAWKAWV